MNEMTEPTSALAKRELILRALDTLAKFRSYERPAIANEQTWALTLTAVLLVEYKKQVCLRQLGDKVNEKTSVSPAFHCEVSLSMSLHQFVLDAALTYDLPAPWPLSQLEMTDAVFAASRTQMLELLNAFNEAAFAASEQAKKENAKVGFLTMT